MNVATWLNRSFRVRNSMFAFPANNFSLRFAALIIFCLAFAARGVSQQPPPGKVPKSTFWIAFDRVDTSEFGAASFPHVDLFLMDIDGRHTRRLTSDHRSHSPSWSPDGSKIAFLAEQRSPVATNTSDEGYDNFMQYRDFLSIPHEVFIMDADGRNSVHICSAGSGTRDVLWFPDAKRLGLRVLDLGTLRVLDDTSGILAPNSLKAETLNVYLTRGTPQPGGIYLLDYWTLLEWIPPVDNFTPTLVASRAFLDHPVPELLGALPSSADLTQALRVVSTGATVGTFPVAAYDLAWSPDGKFIAYSDFPGDHNSILYTARVVDDQVADVHRPLTDQGLDAHGPAWSADGSRIAFMGLWEETSQIFVIAADGSGLIQLTRNPKLSCYHPSWSPDGRWIVAACRPSVTVMRPLTNEIGGLSSIYLFNVDKPEAKPRQLTRCATTDPLPSPTCGDRNPSFAPGSAH